MEIEKKIEKIHQEIGEIQDVLAEAERIWSKIKNFEREIIDPYLAFLKNLYQKRDDLHEQKEKLVKSLIRSSKKKSLSN
jgi:hypothetical protein